MTAIRNLGVGFSLICPLAFMSRMTAATGVARTMDDDRNIPNARALCASEEAIR